MGWGCIIELFDSVDRLYYREWLGWDKVVVFSMSNVVFIVIYISKWFFINDIFIVVKYG